MSRAGLLADLRAAVGPAFVVSEGDLSAWELDWRKRWRGCALAVVRPASTEQVAAVVARDAKIAKRAAKLVKVVYEELKPVLDLNEAGELEVYVDGADEATRRLHLVKGGGGALTREKIVAAASRRFVCIVDEQKLVERLGRFPLPVEVIPMARVHVARQLARLGGEPVWRDGEFTAALGRETLGRALRAA